MQTHKKDIVWPEAGVVRKRGREWRHRGRKREKKRGENILTGLPLLFAMSFSVLFSYENIRITDGWGKHFFLKEKCKLLPSITVWRTSTAFDSFN